MPLTPETIAANEDAVERLGWMFDFRIDIEPGEPVWFKVDGIERISPIGQEGAGGIFALLPDSRVLYVSSEGQAGVLAANFQAFIELIAGCPYWQDILKYSGQGQLSEMRRAAIALEAINLDDEDEDRKEARDFLRTRFDIDEPADPVGELHQAVSTSDVVVRTPDGNPCTTLFNSFTIDDNPMLRDQVD
jgi:hypothetical protein